MEGATDYLVAVVLSRSAVRILIVFYAVFAAALSERKQMIPGELITEPGEIEINAGRKTVKVKVANTGDRPIQVGSHYHFFETNAALRFDRETTRGFRLNIASGTAVRFEPGQEREVTLVEYDGDRLVFGFNGKVMGKLR